MIQRKKKHCISCERETYIYAKKMCAVCYSYEQNKKLKEKIRGKKEKSSPAIQQRQGKGGTEKTESELYEEIWNERPHISEISGQPLLPKGHKLWHWQFSHTLPKGLYNKFRMRKDNIVLMTWSEHQMWEFHADKLKSQPEWEWLFNKREELKAEYHGQV